MPNPPLLLCDTDALIQLLLINEVRLLRKLKTHYGIRPVIMPEVENELLVHKKHRRLIEPILEKSLSSETLTLLNHTHVQSVLTGSPAILPGTAIQSLLEKINELGSEYNLRVHIGEAYTFAAAVVLGVPAMSNDGNAVNTLLNHDLEVPSPVLRSFDLLAFGCQIGLLTMSECEKHRATLLQHAEPVPKEFSHASFSDGLSRFCVRLIDHGTAAVGTEGRQQIGHSRQLVICSVSGEQ